MVKRLYHLQKHMWVTVKLSRQLSGLKNLIIRENKFSLNIRSTFVGRFLFFS